MFKLKCFFIFIDILFSYVSCQQCPHTYTKIGKIIDSSIIILNLYI